MSERSVEERLANLEREIIRLKLRDQQPQPKKNWVSAIIGTAQDDPAYDEILRLGKEIRDADQSPEG